MAFYVKSKHFIAGEKKVYEWHINSHNKKPDITWDNIELFSADGDELEYLKKRFVNLPSSHAYCTWRGDMAQFIFENL